MRLAIDRRGDRDIARWRHLCDFRNPWLGRDRRRIHLGLERLGLAPDLGIIARRGNLLRALGHAGFAAEAIEDGVEHGRRFWIDAGLDAAMKVVDDHGSIAWIK